MPGGRVCLDRHKAPDYQRTRRPCSGRRVALGLRPVREGRLGVVVVAGTRAVALAGHGVAGLDDGHSVQQLVVYRQRHALARAAAAAPDAAAPGQQGYGVVCAARVWK